MGAGWKLVHLWYYTAWQASNFVSLQAMYVVGFSTHGAIVRNFVDIIYDLWEY
jgi:hypothetical protein